MLIMPLDSFKKIFQYILGAQLRNLWACLQYPLHPFKFMNFTAFKHFLKSLLNKIVRLRPKNFAI